MACLSPSNQAVRNPSRNNLISGRLPIKACMWGRANRAEPQVHSRMSPPQCHCMRLQVQGSNINRTINDKRTIYCGTCFLPQLSRFYVSNFFHNRKHILKARDCKMLIKTDYTSNHVEIPDSFLTDPPAKTPVSKKIDWNSTALPQNKARVAFVVDNVLSPEECKQLLSLAEASVPVEGDASPWIPALIAVGVGLEASAPGYRESDRIIWDQQVIADRVGERIMQAEGVRELLASFPKPAGEGEWKFRRFNERMRFLKYSSGQFFKREYPPFPLACM